MKKFRKIYVEITNICNMNCSFCPETKRTKAIMSLKDFEHIAKQLKEYTDYIYLHVKGEPLLHPNLKEILEICKKYNLKINISTNGTLLKEKQNMLKNIRQLNVSLHSFENHNDLELKEYIKSTLVVCDELSKNGVIIRYKLWNDGTSNNNNEKILQIINDNYNSQIQNMSYNKDQKLRDNVYLSIKTPFEWPDKQADEQIETTCYGLRQQLAILVDGTVVPCCVDNDGNINLGNIFENSLATILNSGRALEIKKGFENNKCNHPLCKKCKYRIYVTQM